MGTDYTIFLLSIHYPFTQQLQMLSPRDIAIEDDVAGFLTTTEQEVNKRVLDRIYDYASAVV